MFRLSDVPLSLVSTPRLNGERVYLRAPHPDDWREWAELRAQSRAFLQPWEPTWPEDGLTRDHFRRRLRQHMKEWKAGEGYSFFAYLRDSKALLGGITLGNIRRGVAQSGSIGYWMGQPHAGQGLMQETVRAILPFAFDELKLHRIEAACVPHNEASKGVLRACGFREEGVARQYLRINGKWHDHLLFAMVAADFDWIRHGR